MWNRLIWAMRDHGTIRKEDQAMPEIFKRRERLTGRLDPIKSIDSRSSQVGPNKCPYISEVYYFWTIPRAFTNGPPGLERRPAVGFRPALPHLRSQTSSPTPS
jgi:hypothetical protein